jgi:hypothetical protein
MTDDLKHRAAEAHETYGLALRIAKSYWPEPTPPETLAAVTATVFIALCQRQGREAGTVSHGTTPNGGELPRLCPVCDGPMRDQRATKRGNQPDFKCQTRGCDGALWLDRKMAR